LLWVCANFSMDGILSSPLYIEMVTIAMIIATDAANVFLKIRFLRLQE